MFRTQIQLTEEQSRALKRIAAREGKSVSELIRQSVDLLLRSGVSNDPQEQRRKAIAAAGKLQGGPQDLSSDHDRYLAEALQQ